MVLRLLVCRVQGGVSDARVPQVWGNSELNRTRRTRRLSERFESESPGAEPIRRTTYTTSSHKVCLYFLSLHP